MPKFTQTDLNELQIATDLKNTLQSLPLRINKNDAKSVTVTYDYTTGDLSYEFVDKPASKTTASE